MAEAVVSFVLERVGDLLIREIQFLGGVSGQVEGLQTELKRMQNFLRDADTVQEKNNRVEGCVTEIRDLAYEAENVIETFALEVASRREKGFRKKCKRYATIFIEGAKIYKVGKQIDAIRDKITGLTASLQTYGIKIIDRGEGSSSAMRLQQQQLLRRTYSNFSGKEATVGLGEDIEILVAKLVTEEGNQAVSIFGMGGLGKTTLAKKLYHHEDVKRHFDAFAWACISQQFQPREVLEGILIKLVSPISTERREEISKMKDDEIARELRQVQQMKKCLVVLDDIWKDEDWNVLKHAFPVGQIAGRIICTTRNKGLALHAEPSVFPHEPQTLNKEEGWELFQKKAFPSKTYPDFDWEHLGKEMVKRCAGLPLAIIVLGGLLTAKHSSSEWNLVKNNFDLYLRMGKGQDQEYSAVHGVLALSYIELPFHLKSCFLYLGQFPEDYDIPTKPLFKLWVAEGFVPQKQVEGEGKGTMENLAECYLGELIERCMVQVAKIGLTGKVKTCRLHDLMRDVCLSKASKENFLELVGTHNVNEKANSCRSLRLGVHANDDEDIDLGCYARTPYVRSILFISSKYTIRRMLSTFSHFTLLKILSLENCKVGKERTKEMGCLIHLRYLAFDDCYIDFLPPSIGNLRYLQTLIVRMSHWKSSVKIPNVLWKFEELRHLKLPGEIESRGWGKLLRLGNMRKLQTLTGFDTDKFDATELVKFLNLKNLRIRISKGDTKWLNSIVCLIRLTSLGIDIDGIGTEVKEAELKKVFSGCPHLEKFSLEAGIEKLPEYQHFPPNLTKLTLEGSGLEEDAMATLEKLPNLVILRLLPYSYKGKLLVCSSKGFPRLKTLQLEMLRKLTEWRVDEGAMPSLCELEISLCYRLKMVPEGIKFITTLRELKIKYMPRSFQKRVQVVNGREGEDLYKVRHVPSIISTLNIESQVEELTAQ